MASAVKNIQQNQRNPKLYTFEINNIDYDTANVIRKIMLSYIPTIRIYTTVWEYNESLYSPEIITLRLTSIPLKGNREKLSFINDCPCKVTEKYGCNKCSVKLTLDYKAISDNPSDNVVKSKDLKIHDNNINLSIDDKKVKIIKLIKDTKIKCDCYAIIGVGKTNLVFSPVTIVTYVTDKREKNFTFTVELKSNELTIHEIINETLGKLPLYSKKFSHIPVSPNILKLYANDTNIDSSVDNDDEHDLDVLS